jgi:serine/threonine-protein kinase
MTLDPGTRLGPYEIQALLGQGGMGEVYEARDTRLGRTVAVKVLPAHLAADAERRERFEREARAISSLSHPHICTLHDVGREGGVDYLVMERLEGVTLAHRLQKGALPIEAGLRHGIEIAEGLAEAHRRGIVHRDLKPGNVMLTQAGAKLLDFGLAKPGGALLAAASGAEATALPTEQKPLTAQGTLLGTLQYMSPEQLEGREGDARSDLWALGLVLYEMTTGRRPFGGASQASLIAAILQAEPQPIAALQPLAPSGLDRVVKACLAKDPEARWQSARDLARELRWIAEGPTASESGPARRSRLPLALPAGLLAVAALAAGLAGFALARSRPAPPRPVMRLAVTPPANQPLVLGRRSAVALSPDGKRLVYLGGEGATRHLLSRPLDQLDATPLAGPEGADAPFFSPDGEWVAFFAAGKLKKVPAAGGPVHTLCDAPDARGGSWAADGTIVFAPGNFSGLAVVSANGGAPVTLTKPDAAEGERSHRWPQVLPDGGAALFTIGLASGISFDQARIGLVTLATGERRSLAEHGSYARLLPSGHLLFVRGSTLLAAPFDTARLAPAGAPVPVVEGVRTNASGGAHFSFSGSGALAYVAGVALETDRRLVFADRQGRTTPVSDARHDCMFPRLSPDGGRIAVSNRVGTPDVWVQDIARGTFTRLTSGPGARTVPSWSPDGQRVACRSGLPGRTTSLLAKPADGSGPEETLVTAPSAGLTSSWSPDGRHLAYDVRSPEHGFDVWVMPLGADRTPRAFVRTPANEHGPAFSPDGRPLASGSPLRVSAPRLLFERRFLVGVYDVHPDGRFLLIEVDEGKPPGEVTLVLEWLAELRSRVPVG